jgi:hypothetical protein
MAKNNENNPHLVVLDVGTVSAGTASTITHLKPGKKWVLAGAQMMNEAGIAGDATNHVTVKVQKKGGAVMATYTSDSDATSGFVALTAGEYASMVLSSTEADLEVASTDNLEIDIAHGGTGQALSLSKVQLLGYYV